MVSRWRFGNRLDSKLKFRASKILKGGKISGMSLTGYSHSIVTRCSRFSRTPPHECGVMVYERHWATCHNRVTVTKKKQSLRSPCFSWFLWYMKGTTHYPKYYYYVQDRKNELLLHFGYPELQCCGILRIKIGEREHYFVKDENKDLLWKQVGQKSTYGIWRNSDQRWVLGKLATRSEGSCKGYN